MKSSETDITFLNKLNARDHEAFKQLFREFFQDIAYYSSKILKDTDIAEDIAQEVFIRLWEKENHFENYLALKSYLYLSARNCCLNYIKHHNIVVEHAQNLIQEEADEQTWDTIVESEISSLTGASSSTVRSQKQRGISLLKKMVSPELYTLLLLFLQQNN